LATLQSTRDIGSAGEVADNDLGADSSQRIGTFILASHKRANWQAALAQHLHNSATDCAQTARSACDKNLVFHGFITR
jgi:hypothetical protein